VAAHLRPEPPYAAGPAAARAGATAMLDVSDGLLLDASRIAADSHVTIDVDLGVLTELATQLSDAAEALGDNGIGLRWVLAGGEDHPLLVTFPGPLPDGFMRIGWVREPASAPVLVDGRLPDELTRGATGWDHFAS
jgi:thiamine-monophosphate kinase